MFFNICFPTGNTIIILKYYNLFKLKKYRNMRTFSKCAQIEINVYTSIMVNNMTTQRELVIVYDLY